MADTQTNSFIANVNLLARNLNLLLALNMDLTPETIAALETLSQLDLESIINDLEKGSYLSNRKLDINLLYNMNDFSEDMTQDEMIALWNDGTKTVKYGAMDVYYTDGNTVSIEFTSGTVPVTISSNADLYTQIVQNPDIQAYTKNTIFGTFADPITGVLLRMYDSAGEVSNINHIQLHTDASNIGATKAADPIYTWVDTTSSLEVLSNNVTNLIDLGQYTQQLTDLHKNMTQLLQVCLRIPELIDTYQSDGTPNGDQTIYNCLDELMTIYNGLDVILASPENATIAKESAETALATIQELKGLHVEATYTTESGSAAVVDYSPGQNAFTFFIPKGPKGDMGLAFNMNVMGQFADRSQYDNEPKDFSFFAFDTSKIYFKMSDASGDWSTGTDFGAGPTGADGSPGRGIVSVSFLSTTSPTGLPAQPDSTDTYRMIFSDGTTFDYPIKNSTSEFSTVAQAQTGVNVDTIMSPARVADQITAKIATQAEAAAGTDNTKIMTPLRVQNALTAIRTLITTAQNAANAAQTTADSAVTTANAGYGITPVTVETLNVLAGGSGTTATFQPENYSITKVSNTHIRLNKPYTLYTPSTNCTSNCQCSKD